MSFPALLGPLTRSIRDEGPLDARVVVIGEAAGAIEEATGRPFQGPAGSMLNRWMRGAGIDRRDVRIMNVVQRRPTANKIEAVPRDELALWIDDLHQRLAELTDPWLLVPTGNTALRALIGRGGIGRRRGSIYAYADRRGRTVKVIGSLHPAAVLRQATWDRRCQRDWERIALDSRFRGLQLPVREHYIQPTLGDCYDFLADAASQPTGVLSLDIETPRTITWAGQGLTKAGKPKKPKKVKGDRRITCIGYALNAASSFVIPTTLGYWKDPETLAAVWDVIRALHQLPIAKAGHNVYAYDAYWLDAVGAPVRRLHWDTLAMHHCLDPLDEHGLAFCASVDSREPYWKWMAGDKDSKEDDDAAFDEAYQPGQFYTYCGIDATVARELADTYRQRIDAGGLTAQYQQHYVSLFGPLLRLMRGGVRLDEPQRQVRFRALDEACRALRGDLATLAGYPLTGGKKPEKAKDLSNPKVLKWLYTELKLPRRTSRATGKATANEVALRTLLIHPNPAVRAKAQQPITLILDHRYKAKLKTFLTDNLADADGYVRSTYKVTTTTNRLASAMNPQGRGCNGQNITRPIRDLFRPDKGHVMLEVDQSAAESRVVKVRTGDPRLIEIARRKPWEFDEHRWAASLVFEKPMDDIGKLERDLGKATQHAGAYGMSGKLYSEKLLKDTEGAIVRTSDQCQAMLDRYFAALPAIPSWQRMVRQQLLQDKGLTNSWGRRVDVSRERMDDELYRFGYSWCPQSDVGMLTNQLGLIPLDRWLRKATMQSRILLQVHDSLVISAHPDEAWAILQFLAQSMQQPREYAGVELAMPIEASLGACWNKEFQWKRLPEQAEFERVVRELCSREEGTNGG